MRIKILISLSLFFIVSTVKAVEFADYFTNNACRVDFHLAGNANTTSALIDRIKEEPYWGGRKSNLTTFLNLGEYRFQLTDSISGNLIYTNGFSSLFFEWQTTAEAKQIPKSFEQSIQFPFPKNSVKLTIDKRIGFETWQTLVLLNFSPQNKSIIRNINQKAVVREIHNSTSAEKAVDIAVIAEGYLASYQDKFFADAQKLAENIFSHEPFTRYKLKINIYAIAAVSVDSGVTKPQDNNWKNTALGSHFYTFYEPRYLTSPNIFTIRDYAALVPYDAIYILANTSDYGGGGIYNFYAFASADSKRAKSEVMVHEFGHSFAGLGDEYFYDQQNALDSMYNLKDEPWEPNLTSLIHFDKKWENDLPKGAIIPTPPTDENKKLSLGVFEGGGYLSKGLYRPAYDCRMRTNNAKAFCPICEKSVERMILYLTE